MRGNEVFTGQLFFSDAVRARVYATRFYRTRGQADTTNAEDGIYARGSLLNMTRREGTLAYVGRKVLVVDHG